MLSAKERHMYGLEIGSSRQSEYLSQADYASIRRRLEGTHWWHILHNKLIIDRFYRSSGVPIPKSYGYLASDGGLSSDGQPLACGDDLIAWARTAAVDRFLLKHIGGGGGRSVFVVDGIKKGRYAGFHLADGTVVSPAEIDSALKVDEGGLTGYIIQERLESHPRLCSLTGGARTSFRVNTVKTPSGGGEVQFILARLGRPDRMHDNWKSGSVYAHVSLDGRIVSAVEKRGDEVVDVAEHPTTRERLLGTQLDDFDTVIACAEIASRETPGLLVVGWDIVLSGDGARMIEGNVGWDIALKQRLTGGWRANGVTDAWERYWDVALPSTSVLAQSVLRIQQAFQNRIRAIGR